MRCGGVVEEVFRRDLEWASVLEGLDIWDFWVLGLDCLLLIHMPGPHIGPLLNSIM